MVCVTVLVITFKTVSVKSVTQKYYWTYDGDDFLVKEVALVDTVDVLSGANSLANIKESRMQGRRNPGWSNDRRHGP